MSHFKRDQNYLPTRLRAGNPVAGKVELAANTGGTDWFRIMPDGNDGELISGKDNQLTIGALQDDILEIKDWHLVILNDGYYQEHIITEYKDNVATLNQPIDHAQGLRNAGLESGIEFVIYPDLINPMGITNVSGAAIEIGYTIVDKYTPASTEIVEMMEIGANVKYGSLAHSRVDRLFFRRKSGATARTVYWGEHYQN